MYFQLAQKVTCVAERILLDPSVVSQEGPHVDMIQIRVKCLWRNYLNSVSIFFSINCPKSQVSQCGTRLNN